MPPSPPCGPDVIRTIEVYRMHDTWVFDDPRVDLVEEPFIRGAEKIIDLLVVLAGLPIRDVERARVEFSDIFFGGSRMRMERQPFISEAEDDGGTWYSPAVGVMLSHLRCWLCPALLKYFTSPPRYIYARVVPEPTILRGQSKEIH